MFVNPLAKKTNDAKDDESDWEDVDADDEKKKRKTEKAKKKDKEEKVLGKRKRRGSVDDV